MALPQSSTAKVSGTSSAKNYTFAFILITSLFFFWGFIHNLDPVLIPHLRYACRLNVLQSSLVDSSVFIAYFLMALPAGYVMKKHGYKSGILLGLVAFALGCFLFIPAANELNYFYFLIALFIIACGLTFLETAANPYVTILGSPETATFRLNFAQSFNGLAAFLAPLIGGKIILTEAPKSTETLAQMPPAEQLAYLHEQASTVKMPYMILGIAIVLLIVLFIFTKLPDIKEEEGAPSKGIGKLLQISHLRWAVIAQFFYVGAQVCVFSFFILMASKAGNITEKDASVYLSFAGLAFLIGRFLGTFLMKLVKPQTLLILFALMAAALTMASIFISGIVAVYALIGVCFFMSIMYPTIFSLGVAQLGNSTKVASSLIVMSIVGGAILPPLLGYIADVTQHIQYGYLVPVICFLVVFIYATGPCKVKTNA